MDPTATLNITELKAQIEIIEKHERNKQKQLENNDIDYNLKLIHNIICKRSSEGYFSYRHNGHGAQDDLTNCLSQIYKILSLIKKELNIIKETNV